MIWRGIHFDAAPMHLGAMCWVSQYEQQWKARQWRKGDVWYARLRLGCYRFPGQGKTAAKALDAALKEAGSVLHLLKTGLPF